MTPVEFRGDLWRQKTRVPGLSCGVVCVILRLAVLVELRLVTDGQTQTQAHGYYRGCIASRGKKLWQTMAGVMGVKPGGRCDNGECSADDFAKYFSDKVDSIRSTTSTVPPQDIPD